MNDGIVVGAACCVGGVLLRLKAIAQHFNDLYVIPDVLVLVGTLILFVTITFMCIAESDYLKRNC